MNANKHERIKFSINDYDILRSIELDDERIDSKDYQYKVEKLMWITIQTKLDIFFSIERLNQYFNDFAIHHEQTLKTLLRYIRSIVDYEIVYDKKLNINKSFNINFKLKVYSNSNYAVDKFNKKSILKYVYMFDERSISWINRKQKLMITSITKIEYMTFSTCVKKNLWITQLLKNMSYN